MTLVTEFFNDLRYGARLLRRSFGFTLVAVLSLGLGIGGATAVFSLVNAIVLRMLPVPDPQQLFQVDVSRRGQDYGQLFSAPTFQAARDQVAGRNVELFAATSVAGMRRTRLCTRGRCVRYTASNARTSPAAARATSVSGSAAGTESAGDRSANASKLHPYTSLDG